MGNSSQSSYQSRFQQKYAFNQFVKDSNFGEIKIYRKKQLNFDYVMILQKYVNQDQLPLLAQEISKIHNGLSEQDQPMVLRIFNYEVVSDKWSECKMPFIRLYIQYFNFTLHDLMKRHLERNQCFSYEEVLYIISSILNTYEFFKPINPSYFSIQPESIFLTPEGCLKFSPVKVKDFFQEPDAFCKAFMYEIRERELISFERREKIVLNQIKKLVLLIVNMKKKSNLGELGFIVNKATSIEGLKKSIRKPMVDCLCLSKGVIETTESLDSYRNNIHESRVFSDKSVKKSVKKLLTEKRL